MLSASPALELKLWQRSTRGADGAVPPHRARRHRGRRHGGRPRTGELRELLRWMILARRLDRECMALQRQGELTVYPPFEGQEAANNRLRVRPWAGRFRLPLVPGIGRGARPGRRTGSSTCSTTGDTARLGSSRAMRVARRLVLLLAGCASAFPADALRSVDRSVTLTVLRQDPAAVLGRRVMLGGDIVATRPMPDSDGGGAALEAARPRGSSAAWRYVRRPLHRHDSAISRSRGLRRGTPHDRDRHGDGRGGAEDRGAALSLSRRRCGIHQALAARGHRPLPASLALRLLSVALPVCLAVPRAGRPAPTITGGSRSAESCGRRHLPTTTDENVPGSR